MKTLKTIISITLVSLFLFSCSNDDSAPQISDLNYSNGNLSTGNMSVIDKTAAPAGYTWSELQAGNTSMGFAGTETFSLADDFIVPAGEKWNVNKINFYIYKSNHEGNESPVVNIGYEIYSANPSTAGATKIYGDITVNKYSAGIDSKMYRIANTTGSSNTARKIFKITATAADLELPSGTYWIKWKTTAIDKTIAHYHPANTVVGSAGLVTFNAIQFTGEWKVLENGKGNKVDFPFELIGTKTKI
jgi:hypothetical protein